HANGIKVFFDAVLNHRMGGDERERVPLASGESRDLYTKFNLSGRNKYYSRADEWQWDWQAFDALDIMGPQLFAGKTWDNTSDSDYFMGLDVDYQNELVVDELKEWGTWIINEIGFDGFRIDAIKHIDNDFMRDWIYYIQENSDKEVIF